VLNVHIKSQSLIKATSSLGTPILGPFHKNFLTFKLSCLEVRVSSERWLLVLTNSPPISMVGVKS
jgi:hypothetical protein